MEESATAANTDRYDQLQRRCPMLGHDVTFYYCRSPGGDTLCRRILDCWWERFDIRGFVVEVYGSQIASELERPWPSKPTEILQMVQRVQRLLSDE